MLLAKSTKTLAILAISTGLAAAPVATAAPKLFPAETKWTSLPDWGTGYDAAPAFTPDGKTVYFAHANGDKRAIMVSNLRNGAWSEPKVAPFSGRWRDIEPAMAPDGSYLLFISNRPAVDGGKVLDAYFDGVLSPGGGGNIWRVDKVGADWSRAVRLPDVINNNTSIFAPGNTSVFGPSVARNGNLYFTGPDPKSKGARLYRSQFTAGTYGAPEPLSFSNGAAADFDVAVAPDESFIIFSSHRSPTPKGHDGIFMVFSDGRNWKTPIPLQPLLIGGENRLSPDLKTLYFTSDRPYFATAPATPNASENSSAEIPERIWQISIQSESAVQAHSPIRR